MADDASARTPETLTSIGDVNKSASVVDSISVVSRSEINMNNATFIADPV